MSDLKFNCPHCQQSLEAPEELLGQVVVCPSCGQEFEILKSQLRAAPHAASQNVSVEVNRGASPLGIAALVMGILASVTCWIPFIGVLSIPVASIGLLFGVIGVIIAAVNKKTGFAFPISGSIVCVISILVAFAITHGTAELLSNATAGSEGTNQSIAVRASDVEADPGANQTNASVRELASAAPSVEKWTDARKALRQGDVQVRIIGARVGTILVKDIFGDQRESKDAFLSIEIEIKNLSPVKKIDFQTWRGLGISLTEDNATLTDNYENTYKRVTFGEYSIPVGGVRQESIYPGKSITDVLVFEVPVDGIQWLHLKLPARNFGGKGMLRFEIPAGMIQRGRSDPG